MAARAWLLHKTGKLPEKAVSKLSKEQIKLNTHFDVNGKQILVFKKKGFYYLKVLGTLHILER